MTPTDAATLMMIRSAIKDNQPGVLAEILRALVDEHRGSDDERTIYLTELRRHLGVMK